MRKKWLLGAGLVCIGCLSALADVTIDWTATDLSSDPEVGALLQDGWVVGLYLDQNSDNAGTTWYDQLALDSNGDVVSASGPTSDDLFLQVTTTLVDIGGGDITINSVNNAKTLPDSSKVYTVFFNASSIAAATEIAVTGYDGHPDTPFDIGTPGPVNTEYNVGNEIQSNFYAIPEPAVAGLIGIFGTGLIAVRRVFRKEV